MSARYERVNARDDDNEDNDDNGPFSPHLTIPNSPPPSFHSRASSQSPPAGGGRRHGSTTTNTTTSTVVDSALADAFDTDDDESDDDADDRQRLVRSRDALRPMRTPAWMTTTPTTTATATTTDSSDEQTSAATPSHTTTPSPTRRPAQTPASTGPTTTGRVYGGGIQSDGVFSNLTARPEPGEEKDELPPTYEQAAADAAPPYWETTILAPGLGGPDEVYVDGMPVGSVFSFIWNGMISMSFQVVGFLLTYLLHSTHAAKNGSRAGLGITMIQYGFYLKGSSGGGGGGGAGMAAAGTAATAGKSTDGFASPPDPNAHNFDPGTVGKGNGGGDATGGSGSIGSSLSDIASSEWVAYVLMIVGWLILIKSVSDFIRARRHEQLVLQSPERGLGVAVIAEGENPELVV